MRLAWRRATKHDLPELTSVPPVKDLPPAKLDAAGRYFGTATRGDWSDRVVTRGLGPRSTCRIRLSEHGLDVIRMAGSFRIPADALRGARHDQRIAGKVVLPQGLLVVSWDHGEHRLDTGFRLNDATTPVHDQWVRSIGKLARAGRNRAR